MRYLLATVLAVLTLASPAFASGVSNVKVNHDLPSNAAGARTIYVLGFTTSASGALAPTDRIRVTFPIGTGFGGWAGGVVRDVAAGEDVGNCSNPNNSVVECSLFSGRAIAGSREVRVTFNGVNNAGNFDQHRLTVSTTPDADVVNSPFFTIVPAGQLSQITLANAVPSAAAGARTRYVVEFRTSATGGLSAQANSRFDVTFPPLTGYLGWAGGVVHDVTRGVDVGNCSNPSNATVQCNLFSGQFVNAGDTVRITLEGITNSTDPGTDKIVRVDTTSDWALLPSAPFTVVAADRVSAVTLSNADPSNAAGARTRYVADFTASATGGLSQAANSRIDVTFPTDTTFAGWAGATVRDVTRGVDVGNCSNPSGLSVQCALFTGQFVNAGDALRITFDGITNGPAGANKTVAVSTTSDPQAVSSAPFSIVFAGGLTGVTVANGVPSAAAAARTRYIVGFTTSATGGLSQDANSRIDVTFPAGTSFTGWAGATVSSGGVDVGNCSNPVGAAVQCGLFSGRVIAPGAAVTIAFGGVTNGPAGADKTVSVSTTSDPSPASSAPFSVVAGGTLSAVSVAVGSLAPSARTDYVVRATLSGTGGLAQDANSRIDVTFPAGTSFTGWGGGNVHDVSRAITVGNCSSPVGLVIQCALFSGRTMAAGALLQLTFDAITNPASAGPHQLTVSTTSDTPATRILTVDTVAPAAPTVVSPAEGARVEGGTVTLSGTAEGSSIVTVREGGALRGSAAGPDWSLTLEGVGDGEHVYEVRATDAAGNASAAATRRIVVARPQQATPTPTATPVPTASTTPTPTPTPTFREEVVVAPVSGTIKVCPKGPTGACTTLPAGDAIPIGATVDARKGVVELTSLSAPGAPPQKARFSEGMFVVRQVGAITELTLNEPLDCSRKARAAQKKKPKSRKLWGDGKGKFRTKGSYAAATVRGTKWLVQDTCTTTLVRVTQGVVSVRDNVARKTITLRAGKRYTARPKRR